MSRDCISVDKNCDNQEIWSQCIRYIDKRMLYHSQ